jgi:hypothetical protein
MGEGHSKSSASQEQVPGSPATQDPTAQDSPNAVGTDASYGADSPEQILRHVIGLLSSLRRTVAATMAILGFVYVLGYIAAKEYLQSFGAGWLITEVPLRRIAEFGTPPLLACVFAGYWIIAGRIDRKRGFVRVILWAARVGLGCLFLALMADTVMRFFDRWLFHSAYRSWATLVIWFSVVTDFLSLLLRPQRLGYNLVTFYLIGLTAIYGWFLPLQYGEARGATDSTPGVSRLPVVERTHGQPSTQWRLLCIVEDGFVAVTLEQDREKPRQVAVLRPRK